METLKKFRIYFFIFIGVFLLLTFLTNYLMRDNYKNITNYKIKVKSPEVVVTECKAAYSNGYIKGSVTNNTEELISLKYLQINLYDKDNIYLGSEYKELKKFNPKETINFDINYNYTNINKITLDIIDEIPKKEEFNLLGDMNEDEVKIALPIATFLVFGMIIP